MRTNNNNIRIYGQRTGTRTRSVVYWLESCWSSSVRRTTARLADATVSCSVTRSAPSPRRQKRVIIFSSMDLPRDPLCADPLDVRYFAACVHNSVYNILSVPYVQNARLCTARARDVNPSVRFDERINGEKKLRSERTAGRAAHVIAVDDDRGSYYRGHSAAGRTKTRDRRPADGRTLVRKNHCARARVRWLRKCVTNTNRNMPSVVFAGLFAK